MGLLDLPVTLALNKVRDSVINPKIEGIGVVEEIAWKNRQLYLKLRLEDLEDHPIEVLCSDISLAPDGSSVTVNSFMCNKKFAQAALDNFVAGRTFPIPAGNARLVLMTAKKLLGI